LAFDVPQAQTMLVSITAAHIQGNRKRRRDKT